MMLAAVRYGAPGAAGPRWTTKAKGGFTQRGGPDPYSASPAAASWTRIRRPPVRVSALARSHAEHGHARHCNASRAGAGAAAGPVPALALLAKRRPAVRRRAGPGRAGPTRVASGRWARYPVRTWRFPLARGRTRAADSDAPARRPRGRASALGGLSGGGVGQQVRHRDGLGPARPAGEPGGGGGGGLGAPGLAEGPVGPGGGRGDQSKP